MKRRRRRTACPLASEEGCWEFLIWLSAGLAATALVSSIIYWLGIAEVLR